MSSLSGNMGPTGGFTPSSSGYNVSNKIPSGYKLGRLQQFSPEQMQLFKGLFSNVGPSSYLSRLAGGDEDIFNQIEGPQMRQFSELLGDISSRFSGMGTGARRGSGFNIATSQAASDFAQDLAAKRQSLQRQALMDLMGLSESLLGQRPYEQFLTPKKPSFVDKWLGLAGNVMGAATKGYAGGF